ncbi:MAG: Hsp20/alpha crystallin family protein [Verrucomicrobiae bacterium]|nr:Hsp20/alpha crystallin family protein [Verrucomicrobiae bacterium]
MSPLRQVGRLQEEINRLFEEPYWNRGAEFPALNVYVREDDALITAQVPGIEPTDLDISILGNTLTLRGKRKAEALKEEESYTRQERGTGEFVRSLQLPFQVDSGKVEAQFRNGMLKIVLPRAESDKPKRISVKAA